MDGCIALHFADMLRSSGAFTFSEINELVDAGCLNGLFVLARSTGFIGHYLDQKRSDASGKSQWRVATRPGPAQHDDGSNNGVDVIYPITDLSTCEDGR